MAPATDKSTSKKPKLVRDSFTIPKNEFAAIETLKSHLDLVQVDGGTDYRLRVLEKEGVFHFPLDAAADAAMEQTFESVAGTAGKRDVELEIEGRVFRARRVAAGVGWFEFESVCNGPRGQVDYIELARRFHTVLISQLRHFAAGDIDRRRRFTWLVDEFYDRRVKLIHCPDGGHSTTHADATAAFEYVLSELREDHATRH